MKGTQQHSSNVPVVRHGCGCPHRTKNRVSGTQMPTQEEDKRGEFNCEVALTQPVQGAQLSRVQSINLWVPKLTQKPTKVTTIKKVRNKEIELTFFIFYPVYHQEAVPTAMIEKFKPIIDTSYKPYIRDSDQEDVKEPKIYRTTEKYLMLKRFWPSISRCPCCVCQFGNLESCERCHNGVDCHHPSEDLVLYVILTKIAGKIHWVKWGGTSVGQEYCLEEFSCAGSS
ncbi:hypothetical protein DSO57_1022833 [Entomophthora muscae]|uniref:Uncharacterized protein n=1 Tax=Entomophthora muscae TaxID=34485 RepID=A0ACC2RHM5_9FUNG|nr:hypothetical protein DSO57_1022833 [Entomophthora muscae]